MGREGGREEEALRRLVSVMEGLPYHLLHPLRHLDGEEEGWQGARGRWGGRRKAGGLREAALRCLVVLMEGLPYRLLHVLRQQVRRSGCRQRGWRGED